METARPLGTAIVRSCGSLASTIPVRPLEPSVLGMEATQLSTSAIGACLLVCPYARAAKAALSTRVASFVRADRPLEIGFDIVGLHTGTHAALSVARIISAHARIAFVVVSDGGSRVAHSTPVTVSVARQGFLARALIRPAWASATSVTVLSLSLFEMHLPCDSLPATLQVGFNHTPTVRGAVLSAAMFGSVPGVKAALDAGGSTEEEDVAMGVS